MYRNHELDWSRRCNASGLRACDGSGVLDAEKRISIGLNVNRRDRCVPGSAGRRLINRFTWRISHNARRPFRRRCVDVPVRIRSVSRPRPLSDAHDINYCARFKAKLLAAGRGKRRVKARHVSRCLKKISSNPLPTLRQNDDMFCRRSPLTRFLRHRFRIREQFYRKNVEHF